MDYTSESNESHRQSDDVKLSPAHIRELAESAITEQAARAAGVFSTDDQKLLARLLNRKSCKLGTSLVYPFIGADGKPIDYCRVKPGIAPVDLKKGEPSKYLAPSKTSPRLYIAPNARAILSDPSKPILLTEGTKQALSADHHGFPAIACTGVWAAFQKREKDENGKPIGKQELIPDLQEIPFQDRVVHLCFDSDSQSKTMVAAAVKAMTKALAARGACVKVIRLPDAEDGSKQGIDDFLARHGAIDLARLIDRAGAVQSPEAKSGDGEEKQKSPPVADMMAGIAAAECDLWHDGTSTAFATVGRLSLPIRSKAFKQWLIGRYLEQTAGKVPNSEAIANAVNAIESHAIYKGVKAEAHVRCAGHDGKIYVYLSDPECTIIEITSSGWRVCDSPPLRFRHSPSALPLPMPTRGGSLDPLRELLNADDDGFTLLVGWIMSCFMPIDGNYPILVLTGVQDAAKTTASRVLKALTDPSSAPVRSQPKELRDLMIATRSARVLAFDNLSHVPQWFSDALCCLSTGGGMSTRGLFTDDDEIVFSAKRPLIINSIEDVATRADLLSRAYVLSLQGIPDNKRIDESGFWNKFNQVHASILGAILDRAVAGLRALPTVKLARSPRMADAAKFAHACEIGMGETPKFLEVLEANQNASAELPLAESCLTAPLLALVRDHPGGWQGPATQLLIELEKHLPTDTKRKPEGWPKAANSLSGKLRRLLPSLRKVHRLTINPDDRLADGTRIISIAPPPDSGRETSSRSSRLSESTKSPRELAFLPDDPSDMRPSETVGGSSETPTAHHSRRSSDDSRRSSNDASSDGKLSKTRYADDPDDSDDLSRPLSGPRPKRRFGNNPHKGTVLDPERNGP